MVQFLNRINNNTILIKSWYQNGVKTFGAFLQDGGFFHAMDAFAQRFHLPHTIKCIFTIIFSKCHFN